MYGKRREFLPATRKEMTGRGWDRPDIVLVTGDAYVDHPAFPASILGRTLEAAGFKVCVIPRPDPADPESVAIFGLPRLFFGVTAGALDSMVANYTALKKPRSDDPYAPGGKAGGRPDRAVTVYCNMIRRKFGKKVFIVAGGIEASLRRFAHYDYWSDSVRRPLLMDCGADIIVHGMGEGPAVEIAERLDRLVKATDESPGEAVLSPAFPVAEAVSLLSDVPGVVYRTAKSRPAPKDAVEIPSCEDISGDPVVHARAYHLLETTRDRVQWQNCGGMRVIANPAWEPKSTEELDHVYDLPFTRDAHPMYKGARVPALDSVKFSVTSHRGCVGGCAFCAIGAHTGKTVYSRTKASILREIRQIAAHRDYKGTITDLGGPTANMYGFRCKGGKRCARTSCLWPGICPNLDWDQTRYLDLLKQASAVDGIKHLFVGTGIRHDLALDCKPLIKALAFTHTSGHLKIAPEHVCDRVLSLMRKPGRKSFLRFVEIHRELSEKAGKKQYVIPYLIAAHPGSGIEDMIELMDFLKSRRLIVEQCQIFTPTPGTASTVMYATGLDPSTLTPVFVEKNERRKRMQKALILHQLPESRPLIRIALRLAKRRG